jgi:hypothetical protein
MVDVVSKPNELLWPFFRENAGQSLKENNWASYSAVCALHFTGPATAVYMSDKWHKPVVIGDNFELNIFWRLIGEFTKIERQVKIKVIWRNGVHFNQSDVHRMSVSFIADVYLALIGPNKDDYSLVYREIKPFKGADVFVIDESPFHRMPLLFLVVIISNLRSRKKVPKNLRNNTTDNLFKQ